MPFANAYQAARIRKIRNRLYVQNPHCFWCGCLTVPPQPKGTVNRTYPENEASLDHLYERNHPFRRQTTKHLQRYVLACRLCNSKRSQGQLHIDENKMQVFAARNSDPLLKRIYITMVVYEAG